MAKGKKRVILANPEEPRAGDYSYGLYDKAHPIYGDPETVKRIRGELRGLRGETVTMTFTGAHIDDSGKARKFRVQRTFQLNSYSDVMGPGSAYASAVKYIRDKHSEETLVTYGITVETADASDEDSESDEEDSD